MLIQVSGGHDIAQLDKANILALHIYYYLSSRLLFLRRQKFLTKEESIHLDHAPMSGEGSKTLTITLNKKGECQISLSHRTQPIALLYYTYSSSHKPETLLNNLLVDLLNSRLRYKLSPLTQRVKLNPRSGYDFSNYLARLCTHLNLIVSRLIIKFSSYIMGSGSRILYETSTPTMQAPQQEETTILR